MSCGVGHRLGLDLALLWLWRKPAAIVSIRPLAWETPCRRCSPKKDKKTKKKKKVWTTRQYKRKADQTKGRNWKKKKERKKSSEK